MSIPILVCLPESLIVVVLAACFHGILLELTLTEVTMSDRLALLTLSTADCTLSRFGN